MSEEPGLIFRLGIAHPIRASIVGERVGAIRRCEFSTGAFVEPITRWEAPHRLSFDVAEQAPLPGGRTRLEGSTWYALDLHPRVHWAPIAERLLHRIHSRVLAQVERQAEGRGRDGAAVLVTSGRLQ